MAATKTGISSAAQRRAHGLRQQLLQARQARGISWATVAGQVGVVSKSVSAWERGDGEPSMAHAMSWAYSIGCRFTLRDRLSQVEYIPLTLDAASDWPMREFSHLAKPLKARRGTRKLSQTDLSLMIGVTRSTMRRWEDGVHMPRLLLMIMWADKLDFSVELIPLGIEAD